MGRGGGGGGVRSSKDGGAKEGTRSRWMGRGVWRALVFPLLLLKRLGLVGLVLLVKVRVG